MDTRSQPQEITQNERRQHPHLRALYAEAHDRIDHFFHSSHDWAGSPIDYLAHRLVHEAYPQLSSTDVRVLVGAIERAHQQEGVEHLTRGFAFATG